MKHYMKYFFTKRSFYFWTTLISLLIGIIFFATNHLDFIITAIDTKKINLPNLSYIIMRILIGLILPAVFFVPSLFEFGRIKTAKAIFILSGIFQFLTLTWIFYFLAQNPVSELFTPGSGAKFQTMSSNPFVSNYVLWDTYGWLGSLCTLIYSAALIYTGIYLDDNRIKVRRCVLALLAGKILLPLICNLIYNGRVISMFWLTNNYAELLSFAFLTAAIAAASLSDRTWIEYVWDQVGIDSDADDFEYESEIN